MENLCNDIFLEIFSHLHEQDLQRLRLVNRRLASLLANESIWRYLYQKEETKFCNKEADSSWKQLVFRNRRIERSLFSKVSPVLDSNHYSIVYNNNEITVSVSEWTNVMMGKGRIFSKEGYRFHYRVTVRTNIQPIMVGIASNFKRLKRYPGLGNHGLTRNLVQECYGGFRPCDPCSHYQHKDSCRQIITYAYYWSVYIGDILEMIVDFSSLTLSVYHSSKDGNFKSKKTSSIENRAWAPFVSFCGMDPGTVAVV